MKKIKNFKPFILGSPFNIQIPRRESDWLSLSHVPTSEGLQLVVLQNPAEQGKGEFPKEEMLPVEMGETCLPQQPWTLLGVEL